MKTSSRTQQSKETKKIIAEAKKMLTNGVEYKAVIEHIKNCYNDMAKATGFFDTIQYNKAIKSIIDFM